MVSVSQLEDAQPLDVDDIVHTLEERLLSTGFTNEFGVTIYPTAVEVKQFPEITMEMSDGSKFKLTVEEEVQ